MQLVKWKLPHDIRLTIVQMAHKLWCDKWVAYPLDKPKYKSVRRQAIPYERDAAEKAVTRIVLKTSELQRNVHFNQPLPADKWPTPSASEIQDYLHRIVSPESRMKFLNCDQKSIDLLEVREYWKAMLAEYQAFINGYGWGVYNNVVGLRLR